jgi:hypothetical protein
MFTHNTSPQMPLRTAPASQSTPFPIPMKTTTAQPSSNTSNAIKVLSVQSVGWLKILAPILLRPTCSSWHTITNPSTVTGMWLYLHYAISTLQSTMALRLLLPHGNLSKPSCHSFHLWIQKHTLMLFPPPRTSTTASQHTAMHAGALNLGMLFEKAFNSPSSNSTA